MTDERRFDPEDKRNDPPSEGVRIIGAEEAAEALERGDVAQRRGDDQPRYGDRPTPPAADGPRPVLRFPLGSSSDPRDIERPTVAPTEPISEPVELPHWTEPPTGQVPQILPEAPSEEGDDLDDWTSFATSTPRWRDDADSFDDHEGFEDMQAWSDEAEQAARPGRARRPRAPHPRRLLHLRRPRRDRHHVAARCSPTMARGFDEGFGPELGGRGRRLRGAARRAVAPSRAAARARARATGRSAPPVRPVAATATWAWPSSSASGSSPSPWCSSASAPPRR